MKTQPHAIFLDLDNTLTWRSDRPSEKDAAALAQAQRNGHLVILNTGRAPAFVPPALAECVRFDGHICASVHVEWRGRILLRAELSRRVLRRVCAYYLESGVWAFLEGETRMFWLNDARTHEDWPRVESAEDFQRRFPRDRVYKITASPEITPEGLALLREDFHVILHPNYTEAILRGYDKASGMSILCEQAGIPAERCVAFGDSRNDLEMFRYAGVSVAMGNALPEVKAACRYTTAPVWESGVAAFLESYGLI